MEAASTTSEQERSTSGYSSQHSQPECEHPLMIQVKKANEEKAVLQRHLDVLKDEFERKCSDLRHYRRKCTNLEETQKELQEKISKASGRKYGNNLTEPHFDKMDHQKRTIEKLSARLGQQLSEWKRSSNEKDETILSLEAQLQKIQQCVEILPKESRTLIKPMLKDAGGMNVSRKEIKVHNALRAELWSVRMEHLQNKAMLAIAKQELKDAKNEREASESHLERKIAKQEEQIEKLSGVIEKLIGDEKESSNEKTLKIALLTEKVASLKSSLDQLSERNVALVSALQETQGHKKVLIHQETALKDKDSKIAKLEKDVHSLQTSFGEVFSEKNKLSMELAEAKGYVKTGEKTIQDQAQRLMQKSEAIQQFCQSNVQLSQENVQLKEKLETFMQQHRILEVVVERLRLICQCNIPQERDLLPKLSLLVDSVETRLAVLNQSPLNFNNDGRSQPTVSQSFAALPPPFLSIKPLPVNTPTGTAAQSRRAPVQATVIPSKRTKYESFVGAPPPPQISPQVQTINLANDSEEELDVVN